MDISELSLSLTEVKVKTDNLASFQIDCNNLFMSDNLQMNKLYVRRLSVFSVLSLVVVVLHLTDDGEATA